MPNPNTSLAAGSLDIEADIPVTMKDGHVTQATIDVEPVKTADLELSLFMEEEVEIFMQLSRLEPQSVPVTVTVNGVRQHIFRGVPQVVKRKYLEPLARAVATEYMQTEEQMNGGELPQAVTSASYPFSVVQDSKRGIDWLRQLQRQALFQ
jgi:hypothetical protein